MNPAPQPLKVVAVGAKRALKGAPSKWVPPPSAARNRSPPHVDALRQARQVDTPSNEDSTEEKTQGEGDEWEETDEEQQPTFSMSPTSTRPDRPVPIPPGKTAQDFWFLFGTPQTPQQAAE